MTVAVATALATLRERLEEPSEAQWEDKELRRWMGEGLRDWARRTRLFTDQSTVAVLANIGEYTLDASILAIEHLLWKPDADSWKRPLEARAFSTLQLYINETGSDPVCYSTYGHSPVLKVQLMPIPIRAGTLYLYGPKVPSAIAVETGTGNLDVDDNWYEAILDYAEYSALRRDRQEHWKDVFMQYEAKVVTAIENAATDDALGEFQFTGTGMFPRWLTEFD